MYFIVSVTDSDKHFDSAIMEYQKRLWKNLNILNIKPTKNWTPQQIILQDTKNIMQTIKSKFVWYKIILLSKDWKTQSTFDFQKTLSGGLKVVFVIGWPYGLDESEFSQIDKISFGKMTMAHWLVKLVLLEQLYRVYTLEIGKKYHY